MMNRQMMIFNMRVMKSLMFTFVMAILLLEGTRSDAILKKTTEMVQMPDGVRLATDIYLPEKVEKVPVVLIRTTYGRGGMANMLKPLFEGKGIGLVMQDTRGRFDSEGLSSVFIDDVSDGYETVEWIARQPWSNGKIGTAGVSALGITQYMMDKKAPPHLSCQHVMAAPPSLYDTIVYPGGGVRRGLFYGWMLNNKYPINNIYLILSQMDYDDMWRMMDLSVDYDKVNVPIIHMAGWYDLYLNGQLGAFVNIQKMGGPNARGKQRLVIGPWIHDNFIGIHGTKQGDLDYPANSVYPIMKVSDWFEECFKGKDKGFMKGPAVRYYVMGDPEDPKAPGNVWRSADTWPVPATVTQYYFHKDGVLSKSKPTAKNESMSFVDDPAKPVPTLGSREHAKERHTVDLRPIETRSDVLVFSTPVLDQPVEVTGPIHAKINFKTDVVDTDFVVRLADVYPDGRSMLLTDGILRASHRESMRYRVPLVPGQLYSIDVEVWPTSIIFNKGHRIRVDVSATNFPRFDVNMHNGRYFDLSPGELENAIKTGIEEYVYKPDLAPDAVPANTIVYLDSDRPSFIQLPIVSVSVK
jgi:uncharacterized protein